MKFDRIFRCALCGDEWWMEVTYQASHVTLEQALRSSIGHSTHHACSDGRLGVAMVVGVSPEGWQKDRKDGVKET